MIDLKPIPEREIISQIYSKGRWTVYYKDIYGGHRIPRAHWVWEQSGNVLPQKGEVLHHIDFNPCNDTPKNLQVLTRSEHNTIHNKGNKWGSFPKSAEHKNKIAEANRKRPLEENIKMIASILKENPKYGAVRVSRMLGYASKGWMQQKRCTGWAELKQKALKLITEGVV